MILVLLPAGVQAESKHAGLADAEGEVCLKCHKDLAKAPEVGSVHPPFASGECTVCHELIGNTTFKITDTGDVVCYMCHDAKNTKAAVHGPVASGDCILCHNPHQSPNPKLLLESPLTKLCFNCHDEKISQKEHVHAPVAGGECDSCHDPHESPYSKQLLEEGNALCLMCHMDVEEAINKKKHVHDAIEMVGCTGCHSPHSTENRYQLLMKPPKLCYDCHSDKKEVVKTPHASAIGTKEGCMNCHDPHASDYSVQLKAENIDLCLKCHSRKRKTPKGMIENIRKILKNNPEHHGPILAGDCSACHNPHGSNEWKMLRKTFPSGFYVPFEVGRYGLCFECHEEDPFLKKSTSVTAFRNGNKNLHYVHVSDPQKGRSCRVCHGVHATRGPKHIRDSVLFGKWKIPIDFEITEYGGRCASGCHTPREYNRIEAITNP